jgi:hypothetical protein
MDGGKEKERRTILFFSETGKWFKKYVQF